MDLFSILKTIPLEQSDYLIAFVAYFNLSFRIENCMEKNILTMNSVLTSLYVINITFIKVLLSKQT